MLASITLILVMPWTEYFWRFDKFFRGGQDFELSLLALLTICCLAMVLFQKGKRDLELMLCLSRRLAYIFQEPKQGTPGAFCGLIAPLHAEPLPSPALGKYNLPVRI